MCIQGHTVSLYLHKIATPKREKRPHVLIEEVHKKHLKWTESYQPLQTAIRKSP